MEYESKWLYFLTVTFCFFNRKPSSYIKYIAVRLEAIYDFSGNQ